MFVMGLGDTQGWKLQAVRLSGTVKNRARRVKILNTSEGKAEIWEITVCLHVQDRRK